MKYFDTIEGSFKRTKFLTVSTLVAAAVVALGSLFYSASFVARHTDNIYLLDGNGGAASATVSIWDEGQPRQCMPMPMRMGARFESIWRSSPIIVSPLIRAIMHLL